MTTKRPWSTADGRKFETMEAAAKHAYKMRGGTGTGHQEVLYHCNRIAWIIDIDGNLNPV